LRGENGVTKQGQAPHVPVPLPAARNERKEAR
jgi:hypothetical protein